MPKLDEVKAKLGALKGLAELFLGPKDVVGINIGTYAVKVALFKLEAGAISLKAWGNLPMGAKLDAPPDEKKIAVINALRAFFIEKGIKIKEASTSLSGNAVIVRYVKFPRLTRNELQATLATEAEPFIPFDINEVQLGFHILNEIVEEGQKKMETVLVAVKKDLVGQRLEILQGAGLNPTVMDVDSFALENVHEKIRDPKEGPGATLFLNIGHMVTNLSIVENGVTRVVRDVFISGNTMTKAIMKAFQCEAPKAEELKKTRSVYIDAAEKEKALADGDRDGLGVSQAVGQVAKDLVAEVHHSVDFYLSQGPDRSIGRILLSGGTARLKNLDKHLAQELKVPVSVLNPFSFVKGGEAVPEEIAPAFGVAVGLALIKVNLVPAEILAKARQRQLLLQAAFVGGLLVLLLAGASFGHWYGKHNLERQLAYDETELKRLDAIVKQVEELEKAASAVRARLNVIEGLLRGRPFYPIFMSEFARSVPAGVKVTFLGTSGAGEGALKLTITAEANTNEDIAAWVKTLEKNPKFGGAELGGVTAAGLIYTFAMTTNYTSK
ncbi:MAG: type IV pilus assembly protein PilM [Elusimicrobia bacterium]|nr:type IV pilus assembly protein PilM [Elusimicrobiota bacterium]